MNDKMCEALWLRVHDLCRHLSADTDVEMTIENMQHVSEKLYRATQMINVAISEMIDQA